MSRPINLHTLPETASSALGLHPLPSLSRIHNAHFEGVRNEEETSIILPTLVLKEESASSNILIQCSGCVQEKISDVSEERRGHILRGFESAMHQDKQICGHQMYEEQLSHHRPGYDRDQPTGRLALVFELMDRNIYELIRGRHNHVAEDCVKTYMYQLMKAMDHMHRNGIFHRDIKPENVLITDEVLKLADFGSCRGVFSKQPYTEYISTRWYRAPECLLTDGYYNYKMDMWGVGCVFFEIVSLFPLFPGNNELDQIQKIYKILGPPPTALLEKMKRRSQHADLKFPQQEGTGIAQLIPHASASCVELLMQLLAYNPDDRFSARQALRHSYFKEIREKDKLLQTFNNVIRMNCMQQPSPRQQLQEPNDGIKQQDGLKAAMVNELKASSNQNHTTSSSPQRNIAGILQLPPISSPLKSSKDVREAAQGGDAATPLSNIDGLHSPSQHHPLESKFPIDTGPGTLRDQIEEICSLEVNAHALPPIENNSSQVSSMVPPKLLNSTTANATYLKSHRTESPKASTGKAPKSTKGTKSHQTFPELSPNRSRSSYKPGEPPPLKKRVNNSK